MGIEFLSIYHQRLFINLFNKYFYSSYYVPVSMCWGWSVKWINMDPSLTRLTIQWGSHRNELSQTGMPTCQEQDEILSAPIPWWSPSAEVFGKTNPERLHRYNYTKVLPDETDFSKRKDILSHRCCPFQESKIQKPLPSQRQMWETAGGHWGLAQNGFWAGGGQQRTKDTGRMGGGREKEEKVVASDSHSQTPWGMEQRTENRWRDGLHQFLDPWLETG